MTCQEVIDTLQALANPENVIGMAIFGIVLTKEQVCPLDCERCSARTKR